MRVERARRVRRKRRFEPSPPRLKCVPDGRFPPPCPVSAFLAALPQAPQLGPKRDRVRLPPADGTRVGFEARGDPGPHPGVRGEALRRYDNALGRRRERLVVLRADAEQRVVLGVREHGEGEAIDGGRSCPCSLAHAEDHPIVCGRQRSSEVLVFYRCGCPSRWIGGSYTVCCSRDGG